MRDGDSRCTLQGTKFAHLSLLCGNLYTIGLLNLSWHPARDRHQFFSRGMGTELKVRLHNAYLRLRRGYARLNLTNHQRCREAIKRITTANIHSGTAPLGLRVKSLLPGCSGEPSSSRLDLFPICWRRLVVVLDCIADVGDSGSRLFVLRLVGALSPSEVDTGSSVTACRLYGGFRRP